MHCKRSAFFPLFVFLAGLFAATASRAAGAEAALTPDLRQRCLAVLRAGLASDEFWPSMHAAEALTLAGHGAEVREALAPRVEHETDDQKRCGLARELVRAGDVLQVQIMLDVLAKPDRYGHTHAAESLYKVAEAGDGRLLQAAMKQDEQVKLKLMAAAALARCGNREALSLVRRHLASDDTEGRRIAAWILARLGDKSDIPHLRANLQRSQDAEHISYFEHALAILGDAGGREALARNLDHPQPAVRIYAAEIAGHARAASLAEKLVKMLEDPVLDVRVRAAQSLLLLSQPASQESPEFHRDVYVATPDCPRYSEGSVIRLADGRLLYATTEFTGGGADHSAACIVARESADGGLTWLPQRVLQENVGRQNVMSVSLVRLRAAEGKRPPIGMFYLQKNGPQDLKVYLRLSHDEGRTFQEPIVVTDAPGYHVMNNDRVQVLTTGRIVCPVAWTADVSRGGHFASHVWYSDDHGRTWQRSQGEVDLPRRGAMEPEVIERSDGSLLMIVRTQLGNIGTSVSRDVGQTWGEPGAWDLPSPESPATLRRIPATGDWLLVWNNTYRAGANHGGKRTPLTMAVSPDEGRTWRVVRNLETDANQNYAYTSVLFVHDRVLLTYYVRDEASGRISSRFRSLSVASLYTDGQ